MLKATAIAGAVAIVVLVATHRRALAHVLLGQVDPRPLALFRIAIGIFLVGLAIETAPVATYAFSDEGLLTREQALAARGLDRPGGLVDYALSTRWSLLHLGDAPWMVHAHLGALGIAAVCLALGWHTRIAAVASWFLLASLLRRGDPHWGGEQVFTGFLFPLMFADSGAAYSLDNMRRLRHSPRSNAENLEIHRPIPAWPQVLLVVQLVVAYVANGWTKSGSGWIEGDTLWLSMHLDRYARLDWHALTRALGREPFRLATWAAWWWERLFFVVLVGVWISAARESDAPRLRGRARWISRGAWLVVAATCATWAAIPGALVAEETAAIETQRRAIMATAGAAIVVGVAIAGTRIGSRAARWLDPRPWLVFGLAFHVVSVVVMELGVFVWATAAGVLLCGAAPWVIARITGVASRLASRGVAVPDGLRRPLVRTWLGPDPSPHRWRRVLAATVLAVHTTALVLWQTPALPSMPWRDEARALVTPWMDATFTRQLWSMFAPNAPRSNHTTHTEVTASDDVVDMRTELQLRLRYPYWRHDRWRKIDEVMAGTRKQISELHALYLCRRWALDHGGASPDRVTVQRVAAPFAPASVDDTRAWFWANAETTPLAAVDCKTARHGRPSPHVLRRHGLAADATTP